MPKKVQSIPGAVEESISAAVHLTGADAGGVALLRLLAERVELAAPNDNVSGVLFLRLLADLGLTPAGRHKLGIPVPVPRPVGALAELRARRAGKATGA